MEFKIYYLRRITDYGGKIVKNQQALTLNILGENENRLAAKTNLLDLLAVFWLPAL
jgi:hypothetical protein